MIFSSSWGLYENVLVIHKGNSSLLYQVPPFLSRAIAPILRNFSYCLTGGICSGTELSKRAWRQGVVIRNSYGIHTESAYRKERRVRKPHPVLICLSWKGLTAWAAAAGHNLRPCLFSVVLTTGSDAAELLRAFSSRSCTAPLVEC
ncbi:MAG: hypothetical protein D3914_08955 [Candidatus Electrothrix sp. LOE2]|nr:hypothetical protein [Candidatus Electrothrix sp. LOE2]